MERMTVSRAAKPWRAAIGAGMLLVAAPLLAACSGDDLSRSFGLTRDAPDEFMVTTRAPLSMPPDFSLRPPQPGAARPQELTVTQSAEAAVTGSAGVGQPQGPADSPGQDALLAAAGAPPPADIRDRVAEDLAASSSDHSLTDTLLFWQNHPPPGVVVDPAREADRLHENAALGKPADDGDTVVIQRKTTSLFDNIF
jgi:hypothetical protein